MKPVVVLLLSLLTHSIATAQTNKFSVTVNPYSFLEPDAGFTPGVGYVINKRFAVFTDVGLMFYSNVLFNTQITTYSTRGIKFKPAIRYYLEKHQTQKDFFIELEGLIKLVNYKTADEINLVDNNGNPAFTYIGGYSIKKNVLGISAKIGYREFFGNSKKLGYDVYAGLGIRNKNLTNTGLPSGVQPEIDLFALDDVAKNFHWARGTTISLPAGIKIFYNL
jgi:hypothetical protein